MSVSCHCALLKREDRILGPQVCAQTMELVVGCTSSMLAENFGDETISDAVNVPFWTSKDGLDLAVRTPARICALRA